MQRFTSQFFRLCPLCSSANKYQGNSANLRYSENMSKLEYSDLIFRIGTKIGANQLKRLVFMCREQISEDGKGKVKNALELIGELEKQGNLGIDR